jgi:5-methylcytosine-specific restriction protein A
VEKFTGAAIFMPNFGGQERGGIITPANYPVVLIVSGNSGRQHGYEDHWSHDGIFFYYGEGQRGDMQFTKGNRAVRDHVANGEDVYLFEEVPKRSGFIRCRGQVVCTGTSWVDAPDTGKHMRKAIVFEFALLEQIEVPFSSSGAFGTDAFKALSLSELRSRALANAADARTPSERKTRYFERSRAIKLYILRRAAGKCEGCGADAPFLTAAGPYLEPHHVRRLSDGGPDDPRYVIGVCPNCHRRAHHAIDAKQFNAELTAKVARLETVSALTNAAAL